MRSVIVLIGFLIMIGGFAFWQLHSRKLVPALPAVDSSAPNSPGSATPAETPKTATDPNSQSVAEKPTATPIAKLPKSASAVSRAVTEPTIETRQLLARLSKLDVTHGPVTAQQAAEWKEALAELADQGQGAVSAIGEFLKKHADINFELSESSGSLGFASLRLALLATLQKIGGQEALDVMSQTLGDTVDPAEIATLARYLEKADPQKYREAAVGAARITLNLASSDQWEGRDVAPLFNLLKNYDGTNAIADFEKFANTWFNYAPIVLAQLPDAAGVPSLIRLAEGTGGYTGLGRDISQRMLAQVALQSREAAEGLVEQVKTDRIRASAWPGVASALAGSTLELTRTVLDPTRPLSGEPRQGGYHVVLGNQNYTQNPPPPNMTAEEINGRIHLIETLLAATSNAAAIESLRNARNTLNALAAAKK